MRTLFQSKKAVLTLLAMLVVSALATAVLALYVETFDQAMQVLVWTLGSLTGLGAGFAVGQGVADGFSGGATSGVAP